MITRDVYLNPVLENVPRLLGLLNRNISSSSFGSFDREFWHYNTVDFSCARKQEAVLTLTLLYLINDEKNKYYRKKEILGYIRAALMFWTKIQNRNGSFNEWYPNEHSFVVTSFSTYAVSESVLLIKDELPENEYQRIMEALVKAADWLISRHETRVMNQQTGAAIALLNIHLLTKETKYIDSSREKIALLGQRQSEEGWFLEYGGPDIGYLSLAIDYLAKYHKKTGDDSVKQIIERALSFMKYFIQPSLVAGGEYTSRNTEYLIPHGFELFSKLNDDALFTASVVRKSLLHHESFPNYFDDRYFTYVGYTWLQAYLDANQQIDNIVEDNIKSFFGRNDRTYFRESGLLVINDEHKHFVVNLKKGGAFRLFDKKSQKTYSDSGILVSSDNKWYTSGWLSGDHDDAANVTEQKIIASGRMWKVPDKLLTTSRYVLLRLFQMTFGRSSFISLWMKERLRDILITKTSPSHITYKRVIELNPASGVIRIIDSVVSEENNISSVSVLTSDTHIYVPSSRYYTGMKDLPIQKEFSQPVKTVGIDWKVGGDAGVEFIVN